MSAVAVQPAVPGPKPVLHTGRRNDGQKRNLEQRNTQLWACCSLVVSCGYNDGLWLEETHLLPYASGPATARGDAEAARERTARDLRFMHQLDSLGGLGS